ncbi:hypothetical protein ACWFNE_20165 [Cellulomonas sp. NPDC055163]
MLIWFLAAVYLALISVAVLVVVVVMLRRALTAGDASATIVFVAAIGVAALAQLVWFPTRLIRRGLAERRARLATPGP